MSAVAGATLLVLVVELGLVVVLRMIDGLVNVPAVWLYPIPAAIAAATPATLTPVMLPRLRRLLAIRAPLRVS